MKKIDDLPDVLTASDISIYLGISKGRAYELMRTSDGIPPVRIGRNVRVLKSDLIAWLEERRQI